MPRLTNNNQQQNTQYQPMMKPSPFPNNKSSAMYQMPTGKIFGRSAPMGLTPQEIAARYQQHRASMGGR